jgi:type III pantothenate kinase
MNLVIDNGNTAAKVGIFDHQTLMSHESFSSDDGLHHFLERQTYENVIVSSVKTSAEEILTWVNCSGKKIILSHTLPLPFKNLYKTPHTLGVDRIAAVCGAQQLFPYHNCLVIDTGTCITFDLIDAEGTYHGGAISPGLSMRFRALNTFTARLPLVTAVRSPRLIGDSTDSCIQSGVINGLIAELREIIRQYSAEFSGLRVILCGGDTGFFENQLKDSIFASPELVLVGLNSILSYNVNR